MVNNLFFVRQPRFLLRTISALAFAWLVFHCGPMLSQTAPERFWLAGRYDGNRIVVYFDAVKFRDSFPKDAVAIPPPIADAFYDPKVLSREYVAQFQKRPQAEHFAVGDRYDVLLGAGGVATVTLTSLVGFLSDEGVGNDSYIGALATTDHPNSLLFTVDYYVLRRHIEPQPNAAKLKVVSPVVRFNPDTVRFDIQSRAAVLLTERMKTAVVPDDVKRKAVSRAPILTIHAFTTAGGSTRYYATADWQVREQGMDVSVFRIAAWLAPQPSLHIVAEEEKITDHYPVKQNLLNVVDLGRGRTGLVMGLEGIDSRELRLVEYQDGVALKDMRVLQSISAGE